MNPDSILLHVRGEFAEFDFRLDYSTGDIRRRSTRGLGDRAFSEDFFDLLSLEVL
jgi:hypothetical protein